MGRIGVPSMKQGYSKRLSTYFRSLLDDSTLVRYVSIHIKKIIHHNILFQMVGNVFKCISTVS